MASDSKRKDAMQAVISILSAVTSGGTYKRTLTASGAVTFRVKLIEDRIEGGGKSFCWVRAGVENIIQFETSPADYMKSAFTILIDAIVVDATGETMVEELEDLIHDISLALGANRTLSNTVDDSMIATIDPPQYNLDQTLGQATVQLLCTYGFNYGSEV